MNLYMRRYGATWRCGVRRDGREVLRYKIFEYEIPFMPLEAKRPGLSECPISLGFPVSSFEKAELQPVYAFLPIREYGFAVSAPTLLILMPQRC